MATAVPGLLTGAGAAGLGTGGGAGTCGVGVATGGDRLAWALVSAALTQDSACCRDQDPNRPNWTATHPIFLTAPEPILTALSATGPVQNSPVATAGAAAARFSRLLPSHLAAAGTATRKSSLAVAARSATALPTRLSVALLAKPFSLPNAVAAASRPISLGVRVPSGVRRVLARSVPLSAAAASLADHLSVRCGDGVVCDAIICTLLAYHCAYVNRVSLNRFYTVEFFY